MKTRLDGFRALMIFGLLALIGSLCVPSGARPTWADEDNEDSPSPKQMKTLLRQAIINGDESGMIDVLKAMSRVKGREATRTALSLAVTLSGSEADETWYWLLLSGVSGFKRPEAYTEIGEFAVRYRGRPIARDLLHSLSSNRSKYVNRVVRRVLDRGSDDLKMMALDLAQHIRVRRTVDVLMPFYEIEDRKQEKAGEASPLKKRILAVLQVLTLRTFGDSFPNWQSWWAANRERGLKVLREEAEKDRPSTGLAPVPLDPLREAEWLGMEDIPNGRVLVIKGETARNGNDTNFDSIENMLERLAVKHDVVVKDRLLERGFSLKKYAAIFLNCTQINPFCCSPGHQAGEATGNRLHRCLGPAPHDTFRGKMKPEGVEKIRKWVLNGGYLFSEDWALMDVIQPAFPRFIAGGTSLETSTVKIRPARGMTAHYLLRGVFVPPVDINQFNWDDEDDEEDDDDSKEAYDPSIEDDPEDGNTDVEGSTRVDKKRAKEEEIEDIADVEIKTVTHKWKIDDESPSLNIRSKKVRILIRSSDLKDMCGDPAVAVSFDPGKGRVVHVLSHFGKQGSRVDEATLENLLVNFLIDVKVKVAGGNQ